MKVIKDLTVTVTYTVGFSNIEAPDDVYEGLISRDEFNSGDLDMSDEENAAMEWLQDNIHERDAMEFGFEIANID